MSRRILAWLSIELLLAASLFQAGCAVGPDYHRPPLRTVAGYASTPLPRSTASVDSNNDGVQLLTADRSVTYGWWRSFQSPELNELVERALRNNPTVTAAQAALKQAHESVLAQEGYFLPAVAALYQAERHKIAADVNSSETIGVQGNGENRLPATEDPEHLPHAVPSYYQFHTAELTVAFVPDVFGGNRRQVESLAAVRDMRRYELEATYVTLAANVAAAGIQEAALRAQITATLAVVDAQRRSLDILREQFRVGYASRTDLAAQESAQAQVEASLPPLQDQLEQTHDLIRALAGGLPNTADAAIDLEALQLPPDLPLTAPARLLEQRPDVRAAEAQLRAANAQIGAAVAAMLPQFTITADLGGNATQIPWMFRSGGPFWTLVGSLTQPIFQGGALLHQKRAAVAATKQAAAQYEVSVMTAYQNVGDCVQAILADADQLAALAAAERAARVTLDLTQRQQRAGYVDSLTLLAAESAYQQASLQRVQAFAERLGDSVALFQALGGGWWTREGATY